MHYFILIPSLTLHLAALGLALPAVRGIAQRPARWAILATLSLMAVRLVLVIWEVAAGYAPQPFDWLGEGLGLATGGMALLSIMGLRTILRDRQQTEVALARSERRLRTALEGGGFGAWEWSPEDGLWCDDQVREFFDFRRGAMVTREDLLSRIHPEDLQSVFHSPDRSNQVGQFETEYRVISATGALRWLRTVGRSFPPGNLVGITRDVTHQMRSEIAFRESEQRYRLLADNADDIISLHDLYGRVLYVSPSAQRVTGFSHEELLGRVALTVSHPTDRPLVQRKIRESVARRSPTVFEWRRLQRDGSYLWSETLTRVLVDVTGRPERLICVTRDISARKQSEEALRIREHLYRTIVETAHEGIWLLDEREQTRFANGRVMELLGCSEAELEGASIYDFTDAAGRQLLKENVARRREGVSEQFEFTFRRRDGSPAATLVGTSPVFDELGRYAGGLVMVVDISRRKEQENSLRTLLATQETLLKEIHHRVKNNLAVVVNLLMLQRGRTEEPEVEGILRECQDRVHTMSLIHECLYRSGGEATLALTPFFARLCDFLFQSHALDRERVKIEVRTDDLRVDLDLATPLGLSLNELISNAFKHAFPGRRKGVVRVDLADLGNQHARLVVSDDGVGLPGDIDVATADSLGMKLIRTLTGQLDGELTVSREGGTTFTLTFPLSPLTVKRED